VFTDSHQQDEVARRAPEGWQALALSVDRYGAQVQLPDEASRR